MANEAENASEKDHGDHHEKMAVEIKNDGNDNNN